MLLALPTVISRCAAFRLAYIVDSHASTPAWLASITPFCAEVGLKLRGGERIRLSESSRPPFLVIFPNQESSQGLRARLSRPRVATIVRIANSLQVVA